MGILGIGMNKIISKSMRDVKINTIVVFDGNYKLLVIILESSRKKKDT